MTADQERWAEALAIEQAHGDNATTWIASRTGERGWHATLLSHDDGGNYPLLI